MQHLDFAYAASLIKTFLKDETLVLTINQGAKIYSSIFILGRQTKITTKSVQTEVDVGYEGKGQVVLVEAKNNSKTSNTIIRWLFYPFRQWQQHTNKIVRTLFFEKRGEYYSLWQFDFDNMND